MEANFSALIDILHVSTTFQNPITDCEELKYWLEESILCNYIIICQTLIMLYNCII